METLPVAKLKIFSALQQKKYRNEHNLFIAEGTRTVKEALATGWKIKALVVSNTFADKNDLSEYRDLTIYNAKQADLERITDTITPQGIVAVIEIPEVQIPSQLQVPAFALHNIQDPGNLGTLIRTAAWFGFKAIYCNSTTVDCYNPKVVRSTMGALFHIPVYYIDDFEQFVAQNANQMAAACLSAPMLGGSTFQNRGIILLGNEGNGLPESILATPKLAKVRIGGGAGAESLNVAMAGSILAHALFEQRGS